MIVPGTAIMVSDKDTPERVFVGAEHYKRALEYVRNARLVDEENGFAGVAYSLAGVEVDQGPNSS